ncbi:hypothetical protein OE88DRAFT_1666193 [Heliocybe sulcata]|uniref:Uncharacterized protein n=1 Tax=Heliocybe sulcata TaxID=5364 RepID=A0A5C3MUE9_9AGAM|nr:hypothetical protein OE88DRAFT_1666193 [Heliocybe sulcata]
MLSQDLNFLTAALRLSTKYSVQSLRRLLISSLAEIFPDTLDGFRQRKNKKLFQMFVGEAFVAAELARVGEAPILLPSILYCCCTYPTEHFIDSEQLDWTQKRACVLGRERMMHQFGKLVICLTSPHPNLAQECEVGQTICGDCDHNSLCTVPDWRPALRRAMEFAPWLGDRLPSAFSNTMDLQWSNGVCSTCFGNLQELYDSERRRIWEELPGYLDLGTWNALREATDM